MLTNTITNFDLSVILIPLAQFIILLLAIFGGVVLLIIIINTISRAYKDKLDNKKDIHAKDKDAEITQKIIEYKNTYPNVDLGFILKSDSQKDIENNQEIHELSKRVKNIEFYIKQLSIQQSITIDKIDDKH